jgi:7-carboxy-7-deazaguanine synthase
MISYTEKFASFQGEGRYTGVPSIFLRTFGCNFRCKNFGVTDTTFNTGKYNNEVFEVIKNIDNYKSLEDLPLVHTGCDSYPSIYPEFKRFAIKEDIDTLVNGIVDLLPFKEWRDEHFVITGGEPLLGWQKYYSELLSHPKMLALKELTFETNGTQVINDSFKSFLLTWINHNGRNYEHGVTFSVSPKLSCSGELKVDTLKPEVICEYQNIGFTYLKFVVATEDDVYEAKELVDVYRRYGFNGPVYLMPLGGVQEIFYLNNKRIAELALKNGFRYSDRLHLNLYGNAWNT